MDAVQTPSSHSHRHNQALEACYCSAELLCEHCKSSLQFNMTPNINQPSAARTCILIESYSYAMTQGRKLSPKIPTGV